MITSVRMYMHSKLSKYASIHAVKIPKICIYHGDRMSLDLNDVRFSEAFENGTENLGMSAARS